MTKNFWDIGIKVALATGIIVLAILQWEDRNSVVFVDAQKLAVGYKGMQAAKKEFESKVGIWKANLDTLKYEADAQVNEYESKKAKLTASEKKLMEELIRSKQEQFLNYQQAVQDKVQKEDQELARTVLSKVNDYVEKFGKRKGYKLILAATQYGNIVYAQEGRDVTDEVLTGLNAEYK